MSLGHKLRTKSTVHRDDSEGGNLRRADGVSSEVDAPLQHQRSLYKRTQSKTAPVSSHQDLDCTYPGNMAGEMSFGQEKAKESSAEGVLSIGCNPDPSRSSNALQASNVSTGNNAQDVEEAP